MRHLFGKYCSLVSKANLLNKHNCVAFYATCFPSWRESIVGPHLSIDSYILHTTGDKCTWGGKIGQVDVMLAEILAECRLGRRAIPRETTMQG